LIAVVSVPLAIQAHREYEYRLRLGAQRILYDQRVFLWVARADGLERLDNLHGIREMLAPDDVVVDVGAGKSQSGSSITDEVVSAISHFPTLLCGSGITDAQLGAIATLRAIEKLDLEGNPITDDGMRHLAHMHSMRVLDLSHTSISDAALAYLSAMRHLEQLTLEGDDIGGESLRYLAGVGSLRDLNLSHTKISAAGLAQLGSMRQLEHLYLMGDDVDDASLSHLLGLSSLRWLYLDETGVTDKGLAPLHELTALTNLSLCDCAISDAALPNLASIRSLKHVYLVGTSVTSAFAGELHALKPDATINWGASRKKTKYIGPDGVVRECQLDTPGSGEF
jgi:Leucine-rich repeat (LRR) protein